MASAPLNWLLKIGGDALSTTAKTLTAAVNELNSVLSTLGTRVSKTETDITSINSQVTTELNKKVNKVDALTLEEIEAATDLTNKVAAANAASVLSSRLGGCDFSVEDGKAYVSYNAGTETVKKKLGSGSIYNLGACRTYNLANIVGTENIGKYTKDNFICVMPDYSNSIYTVVNTYAWNYRAYSTCSISKFVISYDNSTGIVSVSGGNMVLSVYDEGSGESGEYVGVTNSNSGTYAITPIVYFLDGAEFV